MTRLSGFADESDVARELDIEHQGDEVFLWAHPPDNTESGQKIVVPKATIIAAVRTGNGRVNGFSPTRRSPKECIVESKADGILLKIHPISGAGSWWVLVNASELESAIR